MSFYSTLFFVDFVHFNLHFPEYDFVAVSLGLWIELLCAGNKEDQLSEAQLIQAS